MNEDKIHRVLVAMTEIARLQTECMAKLHVRLVVLRKAIALNHPDPKAAEEHLCKLEADAEDLVMKGQGFPESAALAALLKAGKRLHDLDS